MARSYYDILGISRKAPEREVRQAYRRLARKYHPDVNPGDREAERKFKEINEAYEVLSDEEKRRKYDQFGENWKYADQFAHAGDGPGRRTYYWTGAGPGRGGTPFDFDLGSDDLGGIFEHFFGGGRGGTAVESTPVEVPVELSLEEAYHGVSRIVQLPTTLDSPGKRLEVKVPAGVDTGSRVHMSVGGMDLYLVVTVHPHHRFGRKGNDLFTDAHVPLTDVLLGSEQEVQTLTGKVMLTVPPESQNGQVFRLRGRGMPVLGKPETRGDLFVTLRVILPTNLSEKERELLQQLKDLRNK